MGNFLRQAGLPTFYDNNPAYLPTLYVDNPAYLPTFLAVCKGLICTFYFNGAGIVERAGVL